MAHGLPPKTWQPPSVFFSTNCGEIEIELYWNHAPQTCRNFSELARRGYYDRTKFHRIIRDFMIQGGDPTGTGRGGRSIFGDSFGDELTPNLKHTGAGILSMANSGPNTLAGVGKFFCGKKIFSKKKSKKIFFKKIDPHFSPSNASQFFITLAPTQWLDMKHTIFGRIKNGMRVVKNIGLVHTDEGDRPEEDVIIRHAYPVGHDGQRSAW